MHVDAVGSESRDMDHRKLCKRKGQTNPDVKSRRTKEICSELKSWHVKEVEGSRYYSAKFCYIPAKHCHQDSVTREQ